MDVSQTTIDSADGHVKASRGDAVKQVRAVRNACVLVEAIAERQPVGVSELARATGIDKSAVQRLVVTLHAAGWLSPHPGSPTRWQISLASPVLRHAAMPNLAVQVQPALGWLRDQSGETVILAARSDARFVILAVAESHHMVRSSPAVGSVLPVEQSAAVAAIAAHLPDGELRLLRMAHPSLGEGRLSEVRRRGWADVESAEGSRAVGAALLGKDGYPIGALAVTGPMSRVSADDLPRLGALVAEAARQALADQPGDPSWGE